MQMGSSRARKVSAGSVPCVVCRHASFDAVVGPRYSGCIGRRPSKANLMKSRLQHNANGLLRLTGYRKRRAVPSVRVADAELGCRLLRKISRSRAQRRRVVASASISPRLQLAYQVGFLTSAAAFSSLRIDLSTTSFRWLRVFPRAQGVVAVQALLIYNAGRLRVAARKLAYPRRLRRHSFRGCVAFQKEVSPPLHYTRVDDSLAISARVCGAGVLIAICWRIVVQAVL
ncbi:hypothetical protein HPB50_014749 [Hyalomma asiaticum]|uniref:Uncharacterized protein n=1 Tax=Hyalomma asiaticum TaxID=266040 RepID=A0ACB7S6S9_HYAAI|nr:hypothetical protein HPB50_014749 [Hyalomma asiaticum]